MTAYSKGSLEQWLHPVACIWQNKKHSYIFEDQHKEKNTEKWNTCRWTALQSSHNIVYFQFYKKKKLVGTGYRKQILFFFFCLEDGVSSPQGDFSKLFYQCVTYTICRGHWPGIWDLTLLQISDMTLKKSHAHTHINIFDWSN